MTRRILLGLLAAAIAIPACRGTHPAPRYAWDRTASFAGLQTWAWYEDPAFRMPHGDSVIDGRFIDQSVRGAVESGLAKKGLRKAECAEADVLVSYSTGDTGVADQDQVGPYDWWTGRPDSTDYEKERAVTIDVRDRSGKLVWRGQITRLEGESPDAVGRELEREVGELLSHFPPAPGAEPTK